MRSLKHLSRAEKIELAEALAEMERRRVTKECEESLAGFIKHAWHVLEPGQAYVHGWHIDAMADHLEAILEGKFNRFLAHRRSV